MPPRQTTPMNKKMATAFSVVVAVLGCVDTALKPARPQKKKKKIANPHKRKDRT
jgi:hypothetical protein